MATSTYNTRMIATVREHAEANIASGWDTVLPASDGELNLLVSRCTTSAQAINSVRRAFGIPLTH